MPGAAKQSPHSYLPAAQRRDQLLDAAGTEAIARAGTSVDETIRRAFTVFLDLPLEERFALRALADTITDGTLERADAIALFVRFVERTLSAWRMEPTRNGGTTP